MKGPQRIAHSLSQCGDVLGGSDDKESACNEGDLGLISGSGRSPGEGNGNPLPGEWTEKPDGLQSMESQRARHN